MSVKVLNYFTDSKFSLDLKGPAHVCVLCRGIIQHLLKSKHDTIFIFFFPLKLQSHILEKGRNGFEQI